MGVGKLFAGRRKYALLVVALVLGSCENLTHSNVGVLKLALTDASVDDAMSVVIAFAGVELQPKSGSKMSIDFEQPRQIDLLSLQGSKSENLLEGVTVAAGEYEWIRLKVVAQANTLDSYIVRSDGTHSLILPSGEENGLTIIGGMSVDSGSDAAYTIDFDLRKSVHASDDESGDYLLKPVLRLVDDERVAVVRGTVAADLVLDSHCTSSPAVYLYDGYMESIADRTPELTSALVKLDYDLGAYAYTLGFVGPGSYTIAYSCRVSDSQTYVQQNKDKEVKKRKHKQYDEAVTEATYYGVDHIEVSAGGVTYHNFVQAAE